MNKEEKKYKVVDTYEPTNGHVPIVENLTPGEAISYLNNYNRAGVVALEQEKEGKDEDYEQN